jgi:ubiquinone biosynthesis protein
MGVRRKLQDLKRFEVIASILSKHGFGMLIQKTTHKGSSLHAKPEVRLRKVFEELGGAFIKLGQLLALRPDLIPLKYCSELEKLQDHGVPISFQKIKYILDEEFSRPLETIYESIDSKPLAVGSIAQVHKAKLVNGERVVIKVLKPKTRETFEEDIDLLSFFATRIKKFIPGHVIDPKKIIDEFKVYTQRELDFSVELEHCEEFSHLDLIMKIPKPYKELSTSKVFVMEFMKGSSLSQKKISTWPKKIRSEIAKHVAYSMMKQVFVYGLFHADPHPGNILVDKNYSMSLIDFGIVGTIDAKTKITLSVMLYALLHRDLKLLSRSLMKLGVSSTNTNRDELECDLKETLSKYYDAGLEDIHMSTLFSQSISIAKKHELVIPEKFVLLGKAIATTESICHLLDPKFNFVRVAKPFLKSHLPKIVSSKFMLSQAKEELLDYGELMISIPKDIKKLVSIKESDHRSFEKLQKSFTHLEKELLIMQKELFIGGLGIVLIVISLLTSSGNIFLFGLSTTSTILFCLGSLMLLSLLRFSHY